MASLPTRQQVKEGERKIEDALYDMIVDVNADSTGANIVVVAVDVSATATSGASAANSALVGGTILGIYPAGNQDQFVDSVTLGGDGAVTVALAAAATAKNQFKIPVLKA